MVMLKRLSQQVDIEIDKGATKRVKGTLQTKSIDGTIAPVNLTGCTGRLHVRSSHKSTDILYEMTTGNDKIVLGDATGTYELIFDAESSSAWSWNEAIYDGFEIEFTNGDVKRVLRGTITAFDEATYPSV